MNNSTPTHELAALSRNLLDAVRAETEYLKSHKLTSPAEAHGAKVFESEVTACADALDAYFATCTAAHPAQTGMSRDCKICGCIDDGKCLCTLQEKMSMEKSDGDQPA